MADKHGAVTRRAVLAESLKLFSTHGYRSTSLARVSEKLGVTRQALYYHFGSKDEILGALFDEMMTKLETAAMGAAADSADELRFEAMLRAHLDATVENTSLVALLLHERPEIATLKTLNATRRRRDYAHLFIEAYEAGVQRGELIETDPWIVVNALLAAINGISWWYHGEPGGIKSPHEREQIAEDTYNLLANGYLRRPSQIAPPENVATPNGSSSRTRRRAATKLP